MIHPRAVTALAELQVKIGGEISRRVAYVDELLDQVAGERQAIKALRRQRDELREAEAHLIAQQPDYAMAATPPGQDEEARP